MLAAYDIRVNSNVTGIANRARVFDCLPVVARQ